RGADRRGKIAWRNRQKTDVLGGKKLCDMTVDVVDLHAAQARLEVDDRARRRHEEVSGNERLNDAPLAQSNMRSDGSPRTREAGTQDVCRAGRIIDLGDEPLGAD